MGRVEVEVKTYKTWNLADPEVWTHAGRRCMILQHQWGFCRGYIEVADLPIIDDQTLSTVVWGLGGEIHALFRDQPMDCLDAPKETLGSRWVGLTLGASHCGSPPQEIAPEEIRPLVEKLARWATPCPGCEGTGQSERDVWHPVHGHSTVIAACPGCLGTGRLLHAEEMGQRESALADEQSRLYNGCQET